VKSQRSPQLSLRLDSAPPDTAARWRDGACIAYLGGTLILQLDTDRKTAMLDGDILHLPLPPAATPRQIQDGAEAWLRQEAARLIDTSLVRHAKRLECSVPRWALSFAARGSWVQHRNDDLLRFNWRLIEQKPTLIDQIVGRAVAELPRPAATADFWGMQAT
jgi:predicted metal-dependent hydrolase